jgi:hypothetical protein
LTVLKGRIIDYCLKIEKNKLRKYKFIVCQGESLYVPRYFAHAYLCLDNENIISYHLSESYNPKNKKILKWNDPDLKINWKIKNPILSNPDKKGESLLVCPKKIFLTGSSGNLGQKLLNQKTNFEILAPSSLEVNIFKLNDIETYLKKNKPQYILHTAGLIRPYDSA